jgi:NAD(P)-dependent dehydrogenase (short-subunit alcohol dehydrogenase family)
MKREESMTDSGEFTGKVVIVTGAASGLGRATALAFARAGAQLALVDIDESGLEAAATSVRELGSGVVAIPTDVSDAVACAATVAAAVAKFGQLDALCNVAGICKFEHASATTPALWDKTFAINVRGPFFLAQAAIPHLIESSGAIVNVASASAFLGHAYLAHYAASKAALVSMTKSLAMEYVNSPVRINALAPGGINTAMTANTTVPDGVDFQLIMRYSPLRGSSEPEDLTELILMLAGPRGKPFHGNCINADRGITAG